MLGSLLCKPTAYPNKTTYQTVSWGLCAVEEREKKKPLLLLNLLNAEPLRGNYKTSGISN